MRLQGSEKILAKISPWRRWCRNILAKTIISRPVEG